MKLRLRLKLHSRTLRGRKIVRWVDKHGDRTVFLVTHSGIDEKVFLGKCECVWLLRQKVCPQCAILLTVQDLLISGFPVWQREGTEENGSSTSLTCWSPLCANAWLHTEVLCCTHSCPTAYGLIRVASICLYSEVAACQIKTRWLFYVLFLICLNLTVKEAISTFLVPHRTEWPTYICKGWLGCWLKSVIQKLLPQILRSHLTYSHCQFSSYISMLCSKSKWVEYFQVKCEFLTTSGTMEQCSNEHILV